MPTRAPRFLITTLALLIAALACVPAPAREAAIGGPPSVAIAAELLAQGPVTKLTLTLSKSVEHRSFVMERPDRAIIDLPEVNFQLTPESGQKREGVVASFRYGLFAPGRSRIVVDLASPAVVERVETTRSPQGATLLAISFKRTDRETFRQASVASDPAPSLRKSLQLPEAGDTRPLVLVDAGHGGTDPGAIASTGVFEKDIVFGFASNLVERLKASGRFRVQMTRDRDVFVPLNERVRIARESKADLFISIHADSISSAPQVRGATIYTGSERATDAESARLAERENRADASAGTETAQGPGDVADILQELTLRETRGFSAGFAGKLLGQLTPVMEMNTKAHREAGFVVLRSPDVPSVLVELGYLSSKQDLERLMSEEWRGRVTASMAKAVEMFFENRTGAARPFVAAPSSTGSLNGQRPASPPPSLSLPQLLEPYRSTRR